MALYAGPEVPEFAKQSATLKADVACEAGTVLAFDAAGELILATDAIRATYYALFSSTQRDSIASGRQMTYLVGPWDAVIDNEGYDDTKTYTGVIWLTVATGKLLPITALTNGYPDVPNSVVAIVKAEPDSDGMMKVHYVR